MNTTTKTIEELKAELAAAEQKLYEEKEALRKAEREAKYEAERIAREAKEKAEMMQWEAAAKEIVKELKVVGFKAASYTLPEKGKFPNMHCFPDERCAAWQVNFEAVYSGGSWHSRENGTKIVVGQYSEASRYPQLKAGGFNYKKIAATAWEKYQAAIAQQKRENNEKNAETSNKARIARLGDQFGKPAYEGATTKEIKNVKVSYYTWHGGGRNGGRAFYRSDNDLMLAVDHITEENAAKLIQFMLDNGMIAEDKK